MATFKILLITVTAVLTFSLVAPFSVDAQDAPTISSEITNASDAVVEATVTTERAFEIDGTPYTVFELAVTDMVRGTTADTVYVPVMGGMFADGRKLSVSHTAHLEVGDDVQVALVGADPILRSSVAAALGSPAESVFTVVDGENGVLLLSGTPGGAEFAGVKDFALTGEAWATFNPALPFYINTAGSNLAAGSSISAIREAAQNWEDDPNSLVDFAYQGTTSTTSGLSDGINTVSFVDRPSESFLARASWTTSFSGATQEFDIIVNTKYRWKDGSGTGTWFDLATTMRHELGHILGLAHVFDLDAAAQVMSPSISSGTIKQLRDGDLAGMNFLYPDPNAGFFCNDVEATVRLAKGESPTNGDDVIVGTSGNDTIDGLGGNDLICGLDGNDTIRGGDGDDEIFGGNGADNLSGNDGRDTLMGDDGNDTINGGEQGDKIWGGNGDDTLAGDGGWDAIYGQNGVDTIRGGFGSDKIFGGDGNDHLFGNNGPDKIYGEAGSDLIEAGKGRDQADGGDGNDVIHGNNGPDTLIGDDGEDTLNGDKGADVLFGGGNNDQLFGGGGWDTLAGGAATDFCSGGFGQDTAKKCESIVSAP